MSAAPEDRVQRICAQCDLPSPEAVNEAKRQLLLEEQAQHEAWVRATTHQMGQKLLAHAHASRLHFYLIFPPRLQMEKARVQFILEQTMSNLTAVYRNVWTLKWDFRDTDAYVQLYLAPIDALHPEVTVTLKLTEPRPKPIPPPPVLYANEALPAPSRLEAGEGIEA